MAQAGAAHKRSSLLTVLPDEASLRGAGPFIDPMQWPASDDSKVPRALRALGKIVDGGLCHRCGSCVGICPTGVLGRDAEEYPTIKHLSACTDCDLCVKVCPGDDFDIRHFNQELFGSSGDLTDTHGTFLEGTIAHATDATIREGSTSGGLVTALLCDMLERGEIDGAVTVVSDATVLWKGAPQIARTREQLLSSMKSKYAISPTNVVLEQIRTVPGRYAVVGLPCQIHGIVKARALDQRINERIVVTIALFCHAAVEHEAYKVIWESLGEKRHRARRFISRIGKHPGTPHVELNDGSFHPVYFGDKQGYRPSSIEMINILYRLFTPDRCLTCFDALGEYADIAVGDPWLAPPDDDVDWYQGWSFALLRSAHGKEVYDRAVASGAVASRTLTRRESLRCNTMMAEEKRWRAFRVIETHRRQGKAIPNYGAAISEFPRHSGWQFVKTEIHMLSHMLCYLPRWRAPVLKFFLSDGGYWLLWLNHKRRVARVWLRDSLERLRRRVKGRE